MSDFPFLNLSSVIKLNIIDWSNLCAVPKILALISSLSHVLITFPLCSFSTNEISVIQILHFHLLDKRQKLPVTLKCEDMKRQ